MRKKEVSNQRLSKLDIVILETVSYNNFGRTLEENTVEIMP